MEKFKLHAVQGSLASLVAFATAKLGILFYVLVVFMIAMIIDFISGMAASKKESIDEPENKDKGWSSKKGLLGIIKKFGYILVVCVAIMVDCLIYKLMGYMDIAMPTTTFFGLLVTVYFVLNECLSIIENAGRMGVDYIPSFLTESIAVLKNNVEKKGKGE